MQVIRLGSFLFFLALFVPLVCAGLTPGKYDFNFQPGYKAAFAFTFVSSNPDAHFQVSVLGDLAQYVQLSDSLVDSSGTVVAYVTFPDHIDVPGVHRIIIAGTELSNATGLGISGEARGLIFIHVPYPGRYLETSISASDVNKGESVPLTVQVTNRGKETVTADVAVDIYHDEVFIERLSLGQRELATTEGASFAGTLDTNTYEPGRYMARALVSYGANESRSEIGFRIGTLSVHLINTTQFIERDTINKFALEVESEWNSPIQNVFANVSVIGTDISFLTPTASLAPFAHATLEGFFDSTGIPGDAFQARVILSYAGSTSEHIVDVRFVREISYLVIGGSVLGLLVVIVLVVYVIRRRHRMPSKRR